MQGLYVLTYAENKAKLREEAIQWQKDSSEHDYSYSELAEKLSYFERKAKRFGLVHEFKENGII